MRDEILFHLEKDARLTTSELAVRIGESEQDVEKELKALQDEKIICGFHTLINWEKTDKQVVTALIEVKVSPQRDLGFDKIAERIYRFSEVKSVYLMSGGFDLTVIVEGKTMKDVAFFVSNKLALLESVQACATHFVLKTYKEHGIVVDGGDSHDERMIVSP